MLKNTFLIWCELTEAFVSYGKVITNKDGIIEIVGLEVFVVRVGDDSVGLVMNIEAASVKALVVRDIKIIQDDLVTPTGTLFYVPIGENLLGRAVGYLYFGNPGCAASSPSGYYNCIWH